LYLRACKRPIFKAFKRGCGGAKTKFAALYRQKLAKFTLGLFNKFSGFESAIFIAGECQGT
jgi:hypothetical protein